MEKKIIIDNKEVTLKSTAATPILYKRQFGRDFFSEMLIMGKVYEPFTKKENIDNLSILSIDELKKIDFEVFYNIAWVFAKTADKNLPDPLTWLDGFETFPFVEIMPVITELLSSINSTKKSMTALNQ